MKSEHDKNISTAFHVMLSGWLLAHAAVSFIFKFEYVMLAAGLEMFITGLCGFISLHKEKD